MENTVALEHANNLLHSILLLMVLSVGAVAAFRTLRLPPILGYLLVGVITGHNAFDLLQETPELALMGEVGVVFLLFAIGLEFSPRQFMAMRTTIIGLGGLQVCISVLAGIAALTHFHIPWQSALVASGAMAMSSTAIVVKQLTDQGELHARHGQLGLGILLFQDIAVVPFLVIIPLLTGTPQADAHNSSMALQALQATGLFILMLLVGHYTLRPLFHYIARAESTELFNITVLLVALTAAWITQSQGLSLALGAFLAGMLLSETEYKHQIESEIRPFRDILMGIFFITVGTKLDIRVLPELWYPILLLVLGLTVGKTLVIAGLTRLFIGDDRTALRTGLILSQGGEFGFALLALALGNGLMTTSEVQISLAAIVISMAVSPLILRYNEVIARYLLSPTVRREPLEVVQLAQSVPSTTGGHVILCGYRRMGQNLARFLEEQCVPYIALDLDPDIVEEAREAGDPVYYADARRPEILLAARLPQARLVVVTVVDVEIAKRITQTVRQKHATIPILVRTRDDRYIEELEDLGATGVLPETLEATFMITHRMLEQLGFPANEVFQIMEKIRGDGYQTLRSYYHGRHEKPSQSQHETFLHTFTLQADDYSVGKSIEELALERFAITVKALRRGEIRGTHPAPTLRLQADDTLVLEGKQERFREVENLLRYGDKTTKNTAASVNLS